MRYLYSFEQSKEYSEAALRLLDIYRLKRNPPNFEVCFNYASGGMPELKKSLDVMLTARGAIADEACEQLFNRFCAGSQEHPAIREARDRLLEELNRVCDQLAAVDRNAQNYGETLDAASRGLHMVVSPSDLRQVVDNLIEATGRMEQRTKELQSELDHSMDEIRELRASVAAVQREAMTDPLTGLANRKGFDEALRCAAAQIMEQGTELCLVMADVDHFKAFNDRWGHQIGDQVLRLVGTVMKQNVKGRDTPARYGGEELAIILPDTTLEAAAGLAEQLRQRIGAKELRNRSTNQRLGQISISFGVARFAPGEPLADFIQRADAALYEAKRRGRNCVISEEVVASQGWIADAV